MRPILPCLLLIATLAACHRPPDPDKGESPVIRQAFAISDFDRVNVRGPDSVVVTQGPRFSVIAEGQRWAVGFLDIQRSGTAIEIARKRRLGPTGSGDADKPVLIRITMPALKGATLTGSGGMAVDRVSGDELTLMLTGGGGLTVGDVAVKRLIADVTGTGTVRIAGRADNGFLSSQGSGSIAADKLGVGTVSISVLGAGGVSVASNGTANISMLGSGKATVLGRPRCTISRTGSGAVQCGG